MQNVWTHQIFMQIIDNWIEFDSKVVKVHLSNYLSNCRCITIVQSADKCYPKCRQLSKRKHKTRVTTTPHGVCVCVCLLSASLLLVAIAFATSAKKSKVKSHQVNALRCVLPNALNCLWADTHMQLRYPQTHTHIYNSYAHTLAQSLTRQGKCSFSLQKTS